ncbi:(deoxy)nucleoside triphosphate pyrophosphohydrolase [Pontibacter toksunensis]|uniref:8-oxo-dGTP diphosphatase n=1 Tax=Pontibacter toksunensis TaxID=1332631 RepID=A0ABW6BMC1_9BACT
MLKVTCAIIELHGKVLVTQRSEFMREPLLWEFPGGKLEQGETEEACLVREVYEELNIHVRPLKRLTPVMHQTKNHLIELIPHICTYVGGVIHLLEHIAFEWVDPSALQKYNWCLPDVPVVEEYLRLKKMT